MYDIGFRVVREVRVTDALRIGRLPDNDLVIDDELVSGYHGRIERAGDLVRGLPDQRRCASATHDHARELAEVRAAARLGSFQFGRGKWHV